MEPNISFRHLTEADATAFNQLRLRALKEHPEAFGQSYESQRDMPICSVRERLRGIQESSDDFILGLFLDELLSGMVGFRREPAEKARHKGLIWGMYVSAEVQGNGNGRELIRRAIEQARAAPGLEQLQLAVTTGNASAYGLYLSMGFQTYGTEPRAVQVNGDYLDEHLMVMFLNN